MLDTPGILWPKFEDKEAGYKLALTGAIKDTLLNMEDLAVYALRFLEEHYPNRLEERYGLTTVGTEPMKLLRYLTILGSFVKFIQLAVKWITIKWQNLSFEIFAVNYLGKLTFDFTNMPK